MKTSTTTHVSDAHRQLAAHLENFVLPNAASAAAPESTLHGAKTKDDFYIAARTVVPRGPSTAKTVLPLRKTMHIYENPLEGLRNTEFRMEAPAAKTVKLAGDFTEWEKSALDMVQSYDGTWFTIVPLLPGTYTYRFIVDGQWLDDPQSAKHVPNPFGSEDAVVSVD